MSIPVIAIFDIGKTNKKVFLFDEGFVIRFEKSIQIPDIKDEDSFPCEDVVALSSWVTNSLKELFVLSDFEIKAINFSAHGASFVNVNDRGDPVTPLYNYLKPFPEILQSKFYDRYGGKAFAITAASPILGHLNSGMQLYWLKTEKPEVFKHISYALHLPEYMSWLVTKKFVSGITSIGCHTNLWDFSINNYHTWVTRENVVGKLAPVFPSDQIIRTTFEKHEIQSGIGLHDSSAALIPYLKYFSDPFVLISTGTWSISLNPFNTLPLTKEELDQDCLCYLTYAGKPVKASRLFAGQQHEDEVKRIAQAFNQPPDFYKRVVYNEGLIQRCKQNQNGQSDETSPASAEEAYHRLLLNLVKSQKIATELVIQNTLINNIFVDGGFSQNDIYMKLLGQAFPDKKVYAATLHQASALGAAMVIHDHWNPRPLPKEVIQTIDYSVNR
jgi:sugar (pentulose or hexulose) kinase